MNRLELHEEFITKRLFCHLVYHPDNHGYIYFKYASGNCHLNELYVAEEYRGSGVAGWLMKKMYEMAKSAGCLSVTCTIIFNTETAEEALAAAIHYGFKVDKMNGSSILMVKEI